MHISPPCDFIIMYAEGDETGKREVKHHSWMLLGKGSDVPRYNLGKNELSVWDVLWHYHIIMFQELLSNEVLEVCMGLSFSGSISFFYRMKIKISERT